MTVSADPKTPQSDAAKAPKAPTSSDDVAVVCGVSSDGKGVDILRKRGERIEAGTVRQLEAGKPIHGEVVRLKPRQDTPLVCDVKVEMPAPSEPKSAGPAQVASAQYRKNWDAIYKQRRSKEATSQKSKRLLN